MIAARSIPRTTLAFISALAVLFALVVPLAGSAGASVDNSFDLQVTPETGTNPTAATHVLTATIDPVCNEVPGCEVDFEVESGPAVSVTADDGTNPRTTDADNTPLTPDMTCTVLPTQATCTVDFTSNTGGANTIRSWVDDDKDNATFDADATEGAVEGTTPGARTEIDDTDVVTKDWFTALPANAALDCTPESQTVPSSGAGSGASISCKAFNDNGAGGGTADNEIQDGTEAAISGLLIDGENLNGANDPDNGEITPADYNNFCTTDANGSCTGTVPASESQGADANICFWGDADNDALSNGATTSDGSDCGEALGAADSDDTDVVQVSWVAPGTATDITCMPRSDQNVIGGSHTVTCTVTDPFGNPSVGALVDFSVLGRNVTAMADNAATDTNGVVSFTYTDVGTPPVPEGQEDEITADLDNGNDSDSVYSYWFTTIPTVADVVIDPEADGSSCEDTDAATDPEFLAANTEIPDDWPMCVTALDSMGGAIPGATVDIGTAGAGFLVEDANSNNSYDEGEALVSSLTVSTDGAGDANFLTYSEESGIQTLTATSGSADDSGSREFYSSQARNITCDPETSTAEPGTSEVVTCTLTDRYGNPAADNVPNTPDVAFTETGEGRIDSSDGTPDENGEVEVIVETTESEMGEQTITAEITNDGDGGVQECEALADTGSNGAGTEDGTPEGNCEATSTIDWTDDPGDPHARTLVIKKMKHVKHRGKRKLLVKGKLSTDDGFAACHQGQKVRLQKKVAGRWLTKKTDTTGTAGGARFRVKDAKGKYRLKAPASSAGDETCGKATSKWKRHRH